MFDYQVTHKQRSILMVLSFASLGLISGCGDLIRGSGENEGGETDESTGGSDGSGGTDASGGDANSGGTAPGSGGNDGSGGDGSGGLMIPDTPYCEPTTTWEAEWVELEQELLVLVNEERAAGADCGSAGVMPPAPPLTMDPALQCAARMHSRDMFLRDFFDHTNPDGDGPVPRMEAAGYEGNGWGENIAGGNDSAAGTMEQWMNSDGHCSNIMNDEFSLIGVGYYTDGDNAHLWTQTFGD
jgi:uncharacterized protein YkwD